MNRPSVTPSKPRRRSAQLTPLEAIDLAGLVRDPERPAADKIAEVRAHAVWRRAVGEGLRSRARVAGYRDGQLAIDVPDAAWKRELERLEPDLLERLRRCAQGLRVEALTFRVRAAAASRADTWRPAAGDRRPGDRAPDSSAPGMPGPGVAGPGVAEPGMGEALGRVADERLRGRIWQVAGRCLAHRKP
jgi:hypothetical protein